MQELKQQKYVLEELRSSGHKCGGKWTVNGSGRDSASELKGKRGDCHYKEVKGRKGEELARGRWIKVKKG